MSLVCRFWAFCYILQEIRVLEHTNPQNFFHGKCLSAVDANCERFRIITIGVGGSLGNWSVCSQVCGGGVRTRSVRCKRQFGSRSHFVDIADCDVSTRPVSVEACNTDVCKDCSLFFPGNEYEVLDSTKNNQMHNEEVIVSCNGPEYSTIDEETITIVKCVNGDWSQFGLSCGKDCGPVTNFDHTQHRFIDAILSSRHGSSRRIQCLDGFSSSEPNGVQISCDNGQWSSWSLSCFKNCDVYTAKDPHLIVVGSSFFHDAELSLRCASTHTGFRQSGSSLAPVSRFSVVCSNGKWRNSGGNPGELVCLENCDSEFSLAYAFSMTSGMVIHGISADVSCQSGYAVASGPSSTISKCQDGVFQFDNDFECLLACPVSLKLPRSYEVIGNCMTEDCSRRVKCSDGYSVPVSASGITSGLSEVQVRCENGKWSEVPFSCYQFCGAWPANSNDVNTRGVIATYTGAVPHGQQIELECLIGYSDTTNQKSIKRECVDGSWHGSSAR